MDIVSNRPPIDFVESRRKFLRIGATSIGVFAFNGVARSQAWPAKPIRIVCAQPPGASVDAMARAYGEYFSLILGVPVVIENKPGGLGMIAAETVAKSAPDGYTFLYSLQSQLAQAPVLLKKTPINVDRDLIPVSAVSPGATAFVVKKDLPVKNYAEFIEYARKNTVYLGNYALGSSWQIQILEMARQTGAKLVAVPYKGGGAMMVDLMSGHIDGGAGSLIGLNPGLQSGAVRPLVSSTDMRSSKFSGVPTWTNVGLHGAAFEDLIELNMLLAPAGTSAAVISRLAQLTVEAAAKSGRVKTVRELAGSDDTPLTGAVLQKTVSTSWASYRKLTLALNLESM